MESRPVPDHDTQRNILKSLRLHRHTTFETYLKDGLNVNHRIMGGFTLLMLAILTNNLPACELLKKYGVDLNQEINQAYKTKLPRPVQAITIAIYSHDDAALKFLLDNGVKPGMDTFVECMLFSKDIIRLTLLKHLPDTEVDQLFLKNIGLNIKPPTTPELALNLLSRPSSLCSMSHNSFLNTIISSNAVAEFVASNAECIAKLNDIDCHGQQLFDTSCTAHVIMNALIDRKLLPESERTNLTEFNIYRQIWIKPNDEADPEKIIAYLTKHGIEISCLDFSSITNRLLTSTLKMKSQGIDLHTSAMQRYGLFKSAAKSQYQEIPDYHQLPANLINDHSTLLLVELVTPINETEVQINSAPKETSEQRTLNTHIVFGQSNHAGLFSVFDPATATTENYSSFEEYADKQGKFTGLSFNIK